MHARMLSRPRTHSSLVRVALTLSASLKADAPVGPISLREILRRARASPRRRDEAPRLQLPTMPQPLLPLPATAVGNAAAAMAARPPYDRRYALTSASSACC